MMYPNNCHLLLPVAVAATGTVVAVVAVVVVVATQLSRQGVIPLLFSPSFDENLFMI